MTPLLQVEGISKLFGRKGAGGGAVYAVRDVSFEQTKGQTLALIGETGAGKSTVARIVARLIDPDSGSVTVDGVDWLALRGEELRQKRAQMQMIFQDPYSSFDPRIHIGASVGEPLLVHDGLPRNERNERVAGLFQRVGLSPRYMGRYPRELSGGQLQRAAVARALTTGPSLIICDEPVAALDVLVRAQTLNLLSDLQEELGLAYLFITHDLSVVQAFASSVIIMKAGEIVERGTVDEVYTNPVHAYTKSLLAAAPKIAKRSPGS